MCAVCMVWHGAAHGVQRARELMFAYEAMALISANSASVTSCAHMHMYVARKHAHEARHTETRHTHAGSACCLLTQVNTGIGTS